MFGIPARFRERWTGRVVGVEVDESWEVVNVFISAGLIKPRIIKLPMESAEWEGSHVAFPEITSGQALRREVPPVAAPARPLTGETPVALPDARLAGLIVEHASGRVQEILFSRAGSLYRLGSGQIIFQGSEIRIAAQTDTLIPYKTPRELIDTAREALARRRELTGEERRGIAVSVVDDEVLLSGNVLTPRSRTIVTQAVAAAVAPTPVRESLSDDLSLELAVSRALVRAGRAEGVHPRSRLGVITLYGHAHSDAAAAEAARAATPVTGVRSVQSRIDVRPRPAVPA
jgi:osmotically-inducible protein OsmY